MSAIVTIAGLRGGAGKSEVAAVLAAAATLAGRRVAAIDAHEAEGPLPMLLGLPPGDSHERLPSWAAAVQDGPLSNAGVAAGMMAPTASGVDLVRGEASLRYSLPDPALMERIAATLATMYDLVVIDSSPLPTPAALGAARAAGALLLVTDPTLAGFYQTRHLAEALAAAGIRPKGLLVNCPHHEPTPEPGDLPELPDTGPYLGAIPWDRALLGDQRPRDLSGPFAAAVRAALDPIVPGIAPPPQKRWWRREEVDHANRGA